MDLRESEPLVIPMREDLPVEDAPLDMVEDGEYVEELDLEEESVLEVYLFEMPLNCYSLWNKNFLIAF